MDTCERCVQHITLCHCDEDPTLTKKEQLGFALWHYTTPTSPRFDPAFARQIIKERRDWFSSEELQRIEKVIAAN
jgi:hypothetical protein